MLKIIKKVIKKLFIKNNNQYNFKTIGERVYIPNDIIIVGESNISIGSNVSFGEDV